jgi:FixJ family two-component response regulator
MPEMSGVELQQRLITDGNDTPIHFHDRRLGRQDPLAGALGFLRKPFDAEIWPSA